MLRGGLHKSPSTRSLPNRIVGTLNSSLALTRKDKDMLNAKNSRPFGKPKRPTGKPKLDGWTVGQCLISGATMNDGTYDAWEITNEAGKRDVVFTNRHKP